MMTFTQHAFRLGTAIATVLMLAACDDVDRLPGGGGHDHGPSESSGRLVFGEMDGEHSHVRVYDLGHGEMEAGLELEHPVTAVHASPGSRYAVVIQRDADRVNFVDGGLWAEDHGDHAHEHEDEPALMTLRIDACVRPTHYEAHDGLAALFCDGLAGEDLPAGIRLFSDHSIGEHREVATQELMTWMHGTAEPRGDWLLTTHREPTAEGSLPSHVELYEMHGDHFHFERRFETECDGLHGSVSNDEYTLFGCTDSVLVVHQEGAAAADFEDFKIATPQRVSQLAGHHGLAEFAGIGGSALYAIDPEAGSAQEVDWRGGAGIERVAHAMDAHGERFVILDNEGTLHVLDPHHGWETEIVVTEVASRGSDDPSIAVASAGDQLFVTDPASRRITVVDLERGEVADRIELGFAPVGLAWVGIVEDDDHGHDHEEDGDDHDGHDDHDDDHGHEAGHEHD